MFDMYMLRLSYIVYFQKRDIFAETNGFYFAYWDFSL